jgi:hypothetical protein
MKHKKTGQGSMPRIFSQRSQSDKRKKESKKKEKRKGLDA